jgi:hypothetical protein
MSVTRRRWLPALALPLLLASACAPTAPTESPAAPAAATIAAPTAGVDVAPPTVQGVPATIAAPTPPALGGSAAGAYAAALPAADAGARLLTLALAADGAATLTTAFLGKGTVVESGKWSQEGNTVTVILTDTDGAPAAEPSTFEFGFEDGNLVNTAWSRELYGGTGLGTLLKQP